MNINHSRIVDIKGNSAGLITHSTTIKFGNEKWNWEEISNHTLLPFSVGETVIKNKDFEEYIVKSIKNYITQDERDDNNWSVSRQIVCELKNRT